MQPSSDDFKDDFTKAAPVILAALEHLESMKDKRPFINKLKDLSHGIR